MNCATCKGGLPLVRFSSLTDTRPQPDAAPWLSTRVLLLNSTELPEKGGPLWSPTTYKPGATRGLPGVESVHAFVADVDDGVSPDVLEAHLKGLGLEFVIHSTHSSTPEHPKFRVVVPLGGPVAAAAWSGVWHVLNEQLALSHSDPQTKDASRAFFWPTHPTGTEPFFRSAHGKPAYPPPIAPAPPPGPGTPLPAQDEQLVHGTTEILTRVEGRSPDGPVFRRLLETTRGEPRSHHTNLLLCGELYRAGATVPQIARFLDWPTSNVKSTTDGFRRKGVYSIQLSKLSKEDPLVAVALEAFRARRATPAASPWEGREGWEEEPLLPILRQEDDSGELDADEDEDEGQEPGRPVETAYVLYNRLISAYYFRPFRTTDGGSRVAIPTDHGLEVQCPVAEDFVDRIGYELFSTRGHRIPFKQLRLASKTLASRSLARSLPRARVVDLSLRVAPSGPLCSRLDMADEGRRCIVVSADGWELEEVGHPIFDTRTHMLPLPVPARSAGADGDWRRVALLWKFIPLPNSGTSGNQRLLALADLVQFVLSPRTPKVVKILSKDEGAGKSTQMGYYQAILDPSTVPHMKPPAPKDDEDAINVAMNRAIVNFDNVSSIPLDLSDYICRIASGTGLVKRAKYTDRDELVVTVWRSVLINGITAIPRFPDLLRRSLFFNPAKVEPRPKELLQSAWEADHPEILGGLLDLCVLTARVLRDHPPGSHPSSMADYVRIGRAVAVACGLGEEAFDAAWEINTNSQDESASLDPLLVALYDFFANRGHAPVRSEDVAAWIMQTRGPMFPKGVSAQLVGNAIGRSRQVLARRGVRIGHQKDHGVPVWYVLAQGELDPEEQIADSAVWGSPGSPGSPGVQTSLLPRQDDRGGLLSHEPDRGSLTIPVGSPGTSTADTASHGGSPQAPPRLPRNRSSENNTPGEPGEPLSLQNRAEGEGAAERGPVRTGERALAEESDVGRTANDARRAAFDRAHPELVPSPPLSKDDAAKLIWYPNGIVGDRTTGEVVWRPGDDPAKQPRRPEPAEDAHRDRRRRY